MYLQFLCTLAGTSACLMTILPSDILEAEHDYTREVKMPFPVSGIKTTALKFNVCVCVCVCISLFSVFHKKKKKKKNLP